jgi:hypothetical protein
MRSTEKILFEDYKGNILVSNEVDELSNWEIDEYQLHVYEENRF